jgi:hypothetical protein
MGMGSCGDAAVAGFLAGRKTKPSDDAVIAGDVLIQLLHSGFAGRSGRRQDIRARTPAAENFIYPFDEEVRVTRQRSSV